MNPTKPTKTVTRYKGWAIVWNHETGCYDLYTPDDADTYSARDLKEYATAEIEDLPTIEEAKQAINNY